VCTIIQRYLKRNIPNSPILSRSGALDFSWADISRRNLLGAEFALDGIDIGIDASVDRNHGAPCHWPKSRTDVVYMVRYRLRTFNTTARRTAVVTAIPSTALASR